MQKELIAPTTETESTTHAGPALMFLGARAREMRVASWIDGFIVLLIYRGKRNDWNDWGLV